MLFRSADAVGHGVESQLSLCVIRVRGLGRQNVLLRQRALIKTLQPQIKQQMRLRVFHLGRNSLENLRGFRRFVAPAERDIQPVRAINQAVIVFRQHPCFSKRLRRRRELALKIVRQAKMVKGVELLRVERGGMRQIAFGGAELAQAEFAMPSLDIEVSVFRGERDASRAGGYRLAVLPPPRQSLRNREDPA